jgi:hypothetical protein
MIVWDSTINDCPKDNRTTLDYMFSTINYSINILFYDLL